MAGFTIQGLGLETGLAFRGFWFRQNHALSEMYKSGSDIALGRIQGTELQFIQIVGVGHSNKRRVSEQDLEGP